MKKCATTNSCKPPKQVRRVCQINGCATLAHFRCLPFCFKHSLQKKLCLTCNKRQQKYSKGLCGTCFKAKYPTDADVRQARMCVKCRVRVTRVIGGTCSSCKVARPKKLGALCSKCNVNVIHGGSHCASCI